MTTGTRQFRELEREVREIASAGGADRLFVITDTVVNPLSEGFLPEGARIVVEAGERHKTLESVVGIWEALSRGGATRRSMIVNVGGGMVSDLGGFAAATFKRGIPYVNVPTTLLAAVDAAIGGKTGFDFLGLKNEIGAFRVPEATLPLTSLFRFLPKEEWLSGAGEALKTAILAGGDLLDVVASPEFMVERNPGVVDEVVARCAAFKKAVVDEDFREAGRRKILNFGHTYGHALESRMLEKGTPVPHGIAVAYGLEYALRLSVKHQGKGEDLLKRMHEILRDYFPPVTVDDSDLDRIRELMGHDKKNREAGRPEFVLLGDI